MARKAATLIAPAPIEDSVISSCISYANGFGKWRTKITFSRPLSENDSREVYNLKTHWSRLRRRARREIISQLLAREQKTRETELDARTRISQSLNTLIVIEKDTNAQGLWHSVTFGEA